MNNWFVSAGNHPTLRHVAKDKCSEAEARALYAEWSAVYPQAVMLRGATVVTSKRSEVNA